MCFKKFQNSRKMSRIKEVLSITYSRRNCNIIVRNHNVEEPFCIPEIFVYQKILCLGGEFIDSLQKKILSHSAEGFCRGTILVRH